MSTYIIAIVILTLFSGLFSATETAYSSSSKIRLKNMANDGKTEANSVLVILDDFDKFLTSVLIGNNIVNIASATISTLLFSLILKGGKGPTVSWSDAMVKEILDNDFYIGTFRLKKRARNTVHGKDKRVPKEEQCIFENHHPAIIDKSTFALVQELKEKRNRTNYRGSRGQWLGSEIPNPFGSCLFCKVCGSRLTPIKRQTSSRERKYYICTTYNTKGRRYCSKAHLIEEENLMEDVLTYIKMCRNALCEVISTYDLKDFEAEKKTVEEKRLELHTAINERKNQLKVFVLCEIFLNLVR